jgi:hypothetical protein
LRPPARSRLRPTLSSITFLTQTWSLRRNEISQAAVTHFAFFSFYAKKSCVQFCMSWKGSFDCLPSCSYSVYEFLFLRSYYLFCILCQKKVLRSFDITEDSDFLCAGQLSPST